MLSIKEIKRKKPPINPAKVIGFAEKEKIPSKA